MCRISLCLTTYFSSLQNWYRQVFKIQKYNFEFLKKQKTLWKSLEGALLWEVKHINFIWRLIKSISSILVVKVFRRHMLIKKPGLWGFLQGGCCRGVYCLPSSWDVVLNTGSKTWPAALWWEVFLQEFVYLNTVCSFLFNALLIIHFHLVTHSNLQMFFRRTFT